MMNDLVVHCFLSHLSHTNSEGGMAALKNTSVNPHQLQKEGKTILREIVPNLLILNDVL